MQNELLTHLLDKLKSHPKWIYQINIHEWSTDFLRFYHSQTNYNISKENVSLYVSIYEDKKSFGFNIDQITQQNIDRAIANAEAIISTLPADPDFVDVETDLTKNTEYPKVSNITAVSLDTKIAVLTQIAAAADELDFELYGSFICNYQVNRVLNSNGLDKQYVSTPIYFEAKAVHNQTQVTVLETFGGEDYSLFDEAAFIEAITAKMRFALNPVVDAEPGEYDVILAPRCIAEFMQYLSHSMSAGSVDQKSSCFEGKQGQKLFPEYVSITDDPTDPAVISFDYNGDGHIYQRLPLVENGVFQAFMCGNYYSHKTGLPNNGNTGSCLVLSSGDMELDALIGSVQNGLYISSLHYMNYINQKETSVTGLTRDGTFLIKDGKITNVVNSLRFTEKLTRIFENIVELENQSYTIPFSENYGSFGIESARAPHVWVKNFNITSSTKTI